MPKLPRPPRALPPPEPPGPPATAEVVVAGAGLAGAAVALALSATRDVLVLDDGVPGASGAAAGIVNPFMGRAARPAWRHRDALDALDALLDAADAERLIRRTGVLRPARDDRQRGVFEDRAAQHDGLDWLAPGAAADRFPDVVAPEGAMWVREGASVDLPGLARAALAIAERQGARLLSQRLTGWRRDGADLVAETDGPSVRCRHLVLALGDGAHRLTALDALPLHRVKGQTLWLARPSSLAPDHPAVAGHGYVVPTADHVLVGATYEHDVTSTAPDPRRDAGLRQRAAALVPALAEADVLDRRAGVRITVPARVSPRRLPLAGPLPGHGGVWILTGLGSKGLLMAPLLARALADALDGGALPPETDPRRVRGA